MHAFDKQKEQKVKWEACVLNNLPFYVLIYEKKRLTTGNILQPFLLSDQMTSQHHYLPHSTHNPKNVIYPNLNVLSKF